MVDRRRYTLPVQIYRCADVRMDNHMPESRHSKARFKHVVKFPTCHLGYLLL